MKPRLLLTAPAIAGLIGLLVSGCGHAGSPHASQAASGSPPPSSSSAPDDMTGMGGMNMSDPAGAGPSSVARMVCSDEIKHATKRAFALPGDPSTSHRWKDGIFACTYHLAGGPLVVSVNDATDHKKGQAFFNRLRSNLPTAAPIKGVEAFGFPAFQTRAGDVAFLKDGKTLHVDATRVANATLPPQFSREDVAYAVAAAVIACWTE